MLASNRIRRGLVVSRCISSTQVNEHEITFQSAYDGRLDLIQFSGMLLDCKVPRIGWFHSILPWCNRK
jgi:hypothetical protein